MVALFAVYVVVVVIVMIVFICLEKIRVNVELGIQVETAQVKHIGDCHIAKMHRFLWCTRVHLGQAMHQLFNFRLGYQIRFADEYLVSKSNLAARFLPVIELGVGVLGIDQRQDGVKQVLLSNFFVHKKSLGHRPRISQTRGFNHYPVKHQFTFALFFSQ